MDRLPVPRKTRHGDEQQELILSALGQAMAIPGIHALWNATALSFLVTWDALAARSPDAARLMQFYFTLRRNLVHALEVEAPSVIYVFGPRLHQYLPAMAFAMMEMPLPPDIIMPKKMHRILPDNPGKVLLDGSILIPPSATRYHRQQLDDYSKSLEPIDVGGRPKGSGLITMGKLTEAIPKVMAKKGRIAQETVAEEIGVSKRALQRFLDRNSVDWRELVTRYNR